MYLSYYGLKDKPFQNSTNADFFWLGEKQKEAIAVFKYGLSKMPGILLLTGDIGTGKTTFINLFLDRLGDGFIVVKVPDPDLDKLDFLKYIADSLDITIPITDETTFTGHFGRFLEQVYNRGQKVILVIDECQHLSSELLKEIVRLALIEKDGVSLLKVILIGQYEFDDILRNNTSRTLHQLIAINYAIEPLNSRETGEYIHHRLALAGATRDIFSPDAIDKIYQFSSGIPRRINMICDHALLFGFGQEIKTINGELIRECASDFLPWEFFNSLEKSGKPVTHSSNQHKPPEKADEAGAPQHKKIIAASAILLVTALVCITYLTGLKNVFNNTSPRAALERIFHSGSENFREASATIRQIINPQQTVKSSEKLDTIGEKTAATPNKDKLSESDQPLLNNSVIEVGSVSDDSVSIPKSPAAAPHLPAPLTADIADNPSAPLGAKVIDNSLPEVTKDNNEVLPVPDESLRLNADELPKDGQDESLETSSTIQMQPALRTAEEDAPPLPTVDTPLQPEQKDSTILQQPASETNDSMSQSANRDNEATGPAEGQQGAAEMAPAVEKTPEETTIPVPPAVSGAALTPEHAQEQGQLPEDQKDQAVRIPVPIEAGPEAATPASPPASPTELDQEKASDKKDRESRQDIDPGAVIDWLLKKQAK